jgi:hypothetical protein
MSQIYIFKIINYIFSINLSFILRKRFLYLFLTTIKIALMSDSYKVKVNDSFQFDFDKEQVSRLDAVDMDVKTFHVLRKQALQSGDSLG